MNQSLCLMLFTSKISATMKTIKKIYLSVSITTFKDSLCNDKKGRHKRNGKATKLFKMHKTEWWSYTNKVRPVLIPLERYKDGSRTAATCKVKLFVIIVNGWKPLNITTKRSTLDVGAILDPPLRWFVHFVWRQAVVDEFVNKDILLCKHSEFSKLARCKVSYWQESRNNY